MISKVTFVCKREPFFNICTDLINTTWREISLIYLMTEFISLYSFNVAQNSWQVKPKAM